MPEVDLERLVYALQLFRGKRSLREVAAEIPGVSYATLYRVESGAMPELNTYLRLCHWMNVDLTMFVRTKPANEQPSPSE